MTLIRCTLEQQKIKSPTIFGCRLNKPSTLALQLTLQWRHLSQRRKKTKKGKREQAMFAVQVDWGRGPQPNDSKKRCQFLILIRIQCTDLQINNGLVKKPYLWQRRLKEHLPCCRGQLRVVHFNMVLSGYSWSKKFLRGQTVKSAWHSLRVMIDIKGSLS